MVLSLSHLVHGYFYDSLGIYFDASFTLTLLFIDDSLERGKLDKVFFMNQSSSINQPIIYHSVCLTIFIIYYMFMVKGIRERALGKRSS